MAEQSKHALKSMMTKFAPDGLFLLSEVAEKFKVKESYLLEMIASGKLKGFQIDGHWFIEEKWLKHFKKSVLDSLETETANHSVLAKRPKKWSRPVVTPNAVVSPGFKDLSVSVWQFSFYSFVLAFAVAGVSYTSLALFPLYENREQLGVNFLTAVDGFYSTPIRASQIIATGKVNDEKLTQILVSIFNLPIKGQVAGASESK